MGSAERNDAARFSRFRLEWIKPPLFAALRRLLRNCRRWHAHPPNVFKEQTVRRSVWFLAVSALLAVLGFADDKSYPRKKSVPGLSRVPRSAHLRGNPFEAMPRSA